MKKIILAMLLASTVFLSACGSKPAETPKSEPETVVHEFQDDVAHDEFPGTRITDNISVEVLKNLKTPTVIIHDSGNDVGESWFVLYYLTEQSLRNYNLVFIVGNTQTRTTMDALIDAKTEDDLLNSLPEEYAAFAREVDLGNGKVTVYDFVPKDNRDIIQTNVDMSLSGIEHSE